MKSRCSFVSNSSSSSYVIKVNKPSEPCKHCGRRDLDLIQLIEQCGEGFSIEKTCVRASYVDNVVNYLNDPYFDKDLDSELIEKLFKIKKEEINQPIVYIISISYHDPIVEQVFQQSVKNKTIEILWEGKE